MFSLFISNVDFLDREAVHCTKIWMDRIGEGYARIPSPAALLVTHAGDSGTACDICSATYEVYPKLSYIRT